MKLPLLQVAVRADLLSEYFGDTEPSTSTASFIRKKPHKRFLTLKLQLCRLHTLLYARISTSFYFYLLFHRGDNIYSQSNYKFPFSCVNEEIAFD